MYAGSLPPRTARGPPTAAYPPQMCMKVAVILFQSWLDRGRGSSGELTPEAGVSTVGSPALAQQTAQCALASHFAQRSSVERPSVAHAAQAPVVASSSPIAVASLAAADAGAFPKSVVAACGPGPVHSVPKGSALLDNHILPELRTHANGQEAWIELGLARARSGAPEVTSSGVLLLLVNTLLVDALRATCRSYAWTSLRISFGSRLGVFPNMCWFCCCLGAGGHWQCKVLAERLGRDIHEGPLSTVPRWFDPSAPSSFIWRMLLARSRLPSSIL